MSIEGKSFQYEIVKVATQNAFPGYHICALNNIFGEKIVKRELYEEAVCIKKQKYITNLCQ